MTANGNETRLAKRILTYTLTPGLSPRIYGMLKGSSINLALLIALAFNAAGLLPSSHYLLSPAYRGKFGIYQVITETAKLIEFSFRRIDQVIIFFAILLGLFLLAAQILIIIMMLFTGSAFAGPMSALFEGNSNFWFSGDRVNAEQDLAYRLLTMVFGLPQLFSPNLEGLLPAFHFALQDMFELYSLAILVVGVLIFLYFVGAVVAETAQSGTPFGKRFNHAWAPIRIVIGLGLIIPFGIGYNSGQWIALYAAKLGSNFATNGWLVFNDTLEGTYLGAPETLIGLPNAPEIIHLGEFFMLAHACNYAEQEKFNRDIDAYVVVASNDVGEAALNLGSTYADALEHSNFEDIYIRFGHLDPVHSQERGFVSPTCGEVHLTTTSTDPTTGTYFMQEAYYGLIQSLWNGQGGGCMGVLDVEQLRNFGESHINYFSAVNGRIFTEPQFGAGGVGILPNSIYRTVTQNAFNLALEACILDAATIERASELLQRDPELNNFGWAGAAIWYNRIANLNGALSSAILAAPRATLYPEVMEYVKTRKLMEDDNVVLSSLFAPEGEDGRNFDFARPGSEDVASALFQIQQYWSGDEYRSDTASIAHTRPTNNAFMDAVNAILGTSGIFDMCKNTDIHPLAQLAVAGKSLLESSIRSMGFSLASGAAGGLAHLFDAHAGAYLSAFGGIFTAVAGIGLLIGFILYYIMPFLPFLYFFFAVGGWIKGLFEAMVGIPLWALAHIRIDGQGIPGDAASDGYFLIFEIFFRPIMIVIGLISSILIFSALVKVLNDIFFIVISNLTGFEGEQTAFCGIEEVSTLERVNTLDYFRGPIDEFFFTIVYAVIVYMIGLSSFKLIDAVPNSIMRWMSVNVKTFGDNNATDASALVQKVTTAGGIVGNQGKQALESLSNAGGPALNEVQGRLQDSQILDRYR